MKFNTPPATLTPSQVTVAYNVIFSPGLVLIVSFPKTVITTEERVPLLR